MRREVHADASNRYPTHRLGVVVAGPVVGVSITPHFGPVHRDSSCELLA